jgi:ribose 1,5-bisphosphokinase PhnN
MALRAVATTHSVRVGAYALPFFLQRRFAPSHNLIVSALRNLLSQTRRAFARLANVALTRQDFRREETPRRFS